MCTDAYRPGRCFDFVGGIGMIAIISERNEVRQEFVCNSADITETGGAATIKDAAGNAFKANHGDKMTCIETHKDYLYDEITEKWIAPAT